MECTAAPCAPTGRRTLAPFLEDHSGRGVFSGERRRKKGRFCGGFFYACILAFAILAKATSEHCEAGPCALGAGHREEKFICHGFRSAFQAPHPRPPPS